MTDYREILFVHFLPSLGFLLALVLLSRILTERRSPASTMAWLLAVIFIPYVAVPMYIIIGGRKIKFLQNVKPMLPEDGPVTEAERAGSPAATRGNESVYDVFCPMLIPPRHHGVYPATRGNRVVLLPEGEQAFDECLALIETARETIYCATFILGNDETGQAIVSALTKKAGQGLNVRLLLDAVGSMKVRGKFLSEFHRAGGKSAFFMPMVHLPLRGRANLRIHRKSLIADNRSAIMGGMNMAWEYMGPYRPGRDRWRDLSLRVEGPAASQISDIFRSDWRFASGEALPAPSLAAPVTDLPGGVQLIASGPDVREDTLREAI
ncbi:MAG: phospholipase D-like domain-containing protein, partial [Thermodesulfobacteriota bacterium]